MPGWAVCQALADEMLPTAWIIDTDHLADDGHTDAGITGPSTAPDNLLARLAAGEGVKFKMYDDDGELYYTGRIIAQAEDGTDQRFDTCGDEFYRPLGDFGGPGAGCVAIKFKGGARGPDAGKWVEL